MDFIIDNFFEIWVGIMLLGILVEVGSIKNALDASITNVVTAILNCSSPA